MIAAVIYYLLAAMLTAFAVLDGFDFGAGLLHRTLARGEGERRAVLASIGPYWDGNEVWLIASGGLLFAAFPSVLGAALSGLYLAIFLLVWLLLGRGLSIELRGHLDDPLWCSFWDMVLTLSSLGICLVLGAAIGNLVRGFHLDAQGDFQLALFDQLSPEAATGILDGYTLATAAYAVLVLGLHGARFLAWKTEAPLGERAEQLARRLGPVVGLAWAVLLALTAAVRPSLFTELPRRPIALVAVALLSVLALLGLILAARAKGRVAFLGSSAHVAGLLLATAVATYPTLLHDRGGHSRCVADSAAGASSLSAIATWYPLGLALAIAYAAMLFRYHRGKVPVDKT